MAHYCLRLTFTGGRQRKHGLDLRQGSLDLTSEEALERQRNVGATFASCRCLIYRWRLAQAGISSYRWR